MKRLLLAVPLLLLAGQAHAQVVETYEIPVTQGQADRVDLGRQIHNEQTCFAASLELDCTQAELDAAESEGTIYPDSEDGRDNFLTFEWALPDFQSVLNEQKRWDTQKAKINWDASTRQDKDAICDLLTLAAGCELY